MEDRTPEHKPNAVWGLSLAAGALIGLNLWERQRRQSQLPPLFEDKDKPKLALITGASSGIGAAYARRLASEHYDVLLVARREARLRTLANSLQSNAGINAEVLVADLSKAEDLSGLEQRIAESPNLDILVNNAGFGKAGSFDASNVKQEMDMVSVHILATLRLTRAALPVMLRRGRGTIINVSSLSAYYPLPNSATYSASKAYLKVFTEALQPELEGTGLRIQSLCPGLTRTEFQEQAQVNTQWLPDFAWMSAEGVVEHSIRDLLKGNVVSVPGFGNQILAWVAPLVPRQVLKLASRRRERKLQKKTVQEKL
ncbi:MAG: SDR family oxidoreductase [Anaerolineae bacterium]|nr:SDR family oxidoreductase [Anaerolineae bacterium]